MLLVTRWKWARSQGENELGHTVIIYLTSLTLGVAGYSLDGDKCTNLRQHRSAGFSLPSGLQHLEEEKRPNKLLTGPPGRKSFKKSNTNRNSTWSNYAVVALLSWYSRIRTTKKTHYTTLKKQQYLKMTQYFKKTQKTCVFSCNLV